MDTHRYDINEYPNLPDNPGVYKFFNKSYKIIYVGKAKNLKKRVSNYFNKISQQNRKTLKLISEIKYIEITIVNSEFDALLLENNLIKENLPKYNILLKDDKSFPSILITNERFPRIYSTRRINQDLGTYFGPYTSVKSMNAMLDLIYKLYKIRTCNYNLTTENINKKKFKICLEYHIGNCLGPCENYQSESEYLLEIEQSKQLLKGNVSAVKTSFKENMLQAALELNFESAQLLKEKIDLLENFQSSSLVVNQKITNIDVITILYNSNVSYINYMKIDCGAIKVSETIEVKTRLDETVGEIIEYILPVLKFKYFSDNIEVLTNIETAVSLPYTLICPQIGDKRKLVDLSVKNALLFKKEKLKALEQKRENSNRVVIQLKKDLRLKEIPNHIECFDNSNIQGSNPVASMVCFINGKPSKTNYRKYNIKTIVGPDDFGSMEEIVTRRYHRLKSEKKKYPNLIVIDGGKGQLSAATNALKKINLYGKIPIIGIAKKLEEIYFPDDQVPLHLNKKSESLKLLQYIRDEAHRFAVTFHRQKRSKNSNNSLLDEISGIGIKTRQKLIEKFKSIERLKTTPIKEIIQEIGDKKAQILVNELQKNRDSN